MFNLLLLSAGKLPEFRNTRIGLSVNVSWPYADNQIEATLGEQINARSSHFLKIRRKNMPTSWPHVISTIMDQVQKESPNSVLDVGIGFGKYGVLLRDVLELPYERYHKSEWRVKIDGVEAFRGYKNPLYDYIYDRVYFGDITDIIDSLGTYDMILLIDVLAHFDKQTGRKLLRKLAKHANKSVIISTPLYPEAQAEYLGNHLEEHKSRWAITDFFEFDFSILNIPIGKNVAQVIHLFTNEQPNRGYPVFDSLVGEEPSKRLTLGYILPHDRLTGGLKMLLEQMKHLRKRGHRIVAVRKGTGNGGVTPSWYNASFDEEILVPPEQGYERYVNDCDLLIAGWMSQIPDLLRCSVPTLYWEQGSEWIFGYCNDLSRNASIRQHLKHCYSLPCFLAAVSPTVARIIERRYGRRPFVLPNGIDTDLYHPQEHHNANTILLVGNPTLGFKGFNVALKALEKVWRSGRRFKVNWVCQAEPKVSGISFPLKPITNSTQAQLASYYRTADIFLFTSWYEGFGMPPLEAMASGVPVITTGCGGVDTYVVAGQNALVADPGDIDSIAYAVAFLLENRQARSVLAAKGRETALKFSFDKVAVQAESLFNRVVSTYRDVIRSEHTGKWEG